MKLFRVCYVVLLGVSIATTVLATELRQQVLLHGQFGKEEDQYGYPPMDRRLGEPVTVVSCFSVTPEHICVFDLHKGDIKVYRATGEYEKTIRALRQSGSHSVPILADDILLVGSDVHVLCEFPGKPVIPEVEWSRFQVFTFDLQTGTLTAHRFFENADAAVLDRELDDGRIVRAPVRRALTLEKSTDRLLLFDHRTQRAYPLSTGDRSPGDQAAVFEGRPIGSAVVRKNWDTGSIELLDCSGERTRMLAPTGTLAAVSDEGAMCAVAQEDEVGREMRVMLYDRTGRAVGHCTIPVRDSGRFKRLSMYQVYEVVPEGSTAALFEVVVDERGVWVMKWHD